MEYELGIQLQRSVRESPVKVFPSVVPSPRGNGEGTLGRWPIFFRKQRGVISKIYKNRPSFDAHGAYGSLLAVARPRRVF